MSVGLNDSFTFNRKNMKTLFLHVFLVTYIVGSLSWSWEQCWWKWLWTSTDM